MVLNYTDANGKRRQPWIPTGLPAKGNKRRAEKLLLDTRKSFVPPVVSKENEDISSDMLFADYTELWLEIIRSSVEKTTFSSYTQMVKGKIAPYFRNTGLTLDGIQAKHIQSFYLHELKTVSPGTVIHYHANIYKALKYAVKMDLIPFNPADKVERPKKQRYIADYYRQEGSSIWRCRDIWATPVWLSIISIRRGDRPTCNSVTDAELGQVMRLPNISPGTTWM